MALLTCGEDAQRCLLPRRAGSPQGPYLDRRLHRSRAQAHPHPRLLRQKAGRVTWAKLDDGFWANPKIDATSLAAVGVYARSLSYCGQHLTDGKITDAAAL